MCSTKILGCVAFCTIPISDNLHNACVTFCANSAVSGRGLFNDDSKADISGSNCFITAELGGKAIYTSYKGNEVVRMCLWQKKLFVHVQPDRHAVINIWKQDLHSLVLGNSQCKQCSNYYLAMLIPVLVRVLHPQSQ